MNENDFLEEWENFRENAGYEHYFKLEKIIPFEDIYAKIHKRTLRVNLLCITLDNNMLYEIMEYLTPKDWEIDFAFLDKEKSQSVYTLRLALFY